MANENKKCDGCSHDENCSGEIFSVIITGFGNGELYYDYCQASIDADRAKGLTVTLKSTPHDNQ